MPSHQIENLTGFDSSIKESQHSFASKNNASQKQQMSIIMDISIDQQKLRRRKALEKLRFSSHK